MSSSVRVSVVVSVAATDTTTADYPGERRQGDAATGHDRPTRACPGQPGHPPGCVVGSTGPLALVLLDFANVDVINVFM